MVYYYYIKAKPRNSNDDSWLHFIHRTDTPTNLYMEQVRADRALNNSLQVLSVTSITELESIKILTSIIAKNLPIILN